MRVLIVTNTYPPADITGVGALAVELSRGLVAHGHQVSVLTRVAPAGDAIALGVGGSKLWFPLKAAVAYLSLVDRPDLVHVHESDGAFVLLAARLARVFSGRRPRLVATLQVSYVRERRAVRPLRVNGRIVSTPTASEWRFAWLRAPLHAWLGRFTARLADAVVAPSDATAKELAFDYGARVRAVIGNGLAVPGASQVGRSTTPAVLYGGRLRTRKGVAVLLAAMVAVRARVPAVELWIAGDGEQRPALEAQARALGVGDCVRFLGAVPRDAMARLFDTAWLFVLPSTYEGFPVAILEAMAHGLAVVSTRVAGIPEAVIEGETGLLVEPEDGDGLGEAVSRLLVDGDRRERMGDAGRRRFRQHFGLEPILRAHLDLYAAVMREARA